MLFVYLDIVKEFSCRQCGRCCRNDWLVTVDEAGYQRNHELFAAMGLEPEFRQAFYRLGKDADYGEFAGVAKKSVGGCWFLTEDNLCRLQRLAGHAHLDTVCQWFPRYPMDTERGVELSLSFSCPAALQLALREEPLQVLRSEQSPLAMTPPDFVTYVYPGQKPDTQAMHYYFAIEGHLIDILQSRRISLQNRLGIVSRSLECLAGLAESETMAEQLRRLFRQNYERIDAGPTVDAAENQPVGWLMENWFVNFFFRKHLYSQGAAAALEQVWTMKERLQAALKEKNDLCPEGGAVFEAIVQLEMEYNHRSSNNSQRK